LNSFPKVSGSLVFTQLPNLRLQEEKLGQPSSGAVLSVRASQFDLKKIAEVDSGNRKSASDACFRIK